ncbi:hypothetical protein CW749_27130 [Vibrio sp. vnigr-6D03]|nr:hypothetical protein CW749_27130 [Vibrio sp. vnigr-6D03]
MESKEQLIDLIRELSAENTSKWENVSTSDFLEALGAWFEDADGVYRNLNLSTNADKPSWQLFADALQAATIYE